MKRYLCNKCLRIKDGDKFFWYGRTNRGKLRMLAYKERYEDIPGRGRNGHRYDYVTMPFCILCTYKTRPVSEKLDRYARRLYKRGLKAPPKVKSRKLSLFRR